MFHVKDLIRDGLPSISLSIGAGELTCLSGPSGCGKTQLLRALIDLDCNTGSISLQGVSRESLAPPQWRRRVALLPADSHWWESTVGEHFATLDEQQLQQLGFEPEVAGWRVERLSSGEKQRLALLRVLANRPQVLLLDEPTANLDTANTRRVERLVKSYLQANQASCLWVSHDQEQIARLCDRCFEMGSAGLREIA